MVKSRDVVDVRVVDDELVGSLVLGNMVVESVAVLIILQVG